jgi:hypothetical protein
MGLLHFVPYRRPRTSQYLLMFVNSLEEILQLQIYIGRCEILGFQLTQIVGKN